MFSDYFAGDVNSESGESQVSSQAQKTNQNSSWVLYGVCGGISYGVGAFFLRQSADQDGAFDFKSFTGICFGLLPVYFIYHAVAALMSKKRSGKFWNKSTSALYEENTYGEHKFRKMAAVGLVVRAAQSLATQACNYTSLTFALRVGMNPAALSSLTSLQMVMTALLFYILFKESLYLGHYLGMICFLLSGVVISFSAPEGVSLQQSLIPVSFTILLAITLCF